MQTYIESSALKKNRICFGSKQNDHALVYPAADIEAIQSNNFFVDFRLYTESNDRCPNFSWPSGIALPFDVNQFNAVRQSDWSEYCASQVPKYIYDDRTSILGEGHLDGGCKMLAAYCVDALPWLV